MYWFIDNPELIPKVAEHYGWPKGSTNKRWSEGPGKDKAMGALKEARVGLAGFGSQMKDIDDWASFMQARNVPRALWDNYAREVVGAMAESSKTGFGSATPTMGCRIGGKEKCSKCYAESKEWQSSGYYNNAWKHLRRMGAEPDLAASAMAFLIDKHPSFRGNIGGDYQNVGHLAQSLSVARKTPKQSHWLHTREIPTVLEYLNQFEEGSQEWLNAIPQNARIRFSMPHDLMNPDEVTNSAWNALLDPNDPNKGRHPRVTPTKTGKAEEGQFACPTTMGIVDSRGNKIDSCKGAFCNECPEGESTVAYAPTWSGSLNVNMTDQHGVERRAYTKEEWIEAQAKAQEEYNKRTQATSSIDDILNLSADNAFDYAWSLIKQ